MKLGVYTIINDKLPKLFKIKDINVNKDDFKYEKSIVDIFRRELNIDKLDSEFVYALSLSYSLEPRGIILIGMGSNQMCTPNFRGLGIGLLLTGAEQFYVFHNHPGKNKKPSDGDKVMTEKYDDLGYTLGIDFCKHILIAGNYYKEC